MNGKDKKDLELIVYRLDQAEVKREELKEGLNLQIKEIHQSMIIAHQKTSDDLKFIKENLFDPKEGLWAETKVNTSFMKNVRRVFWMTISGVALVVSGFMFDYFNK